MDYIAEKLRNGQPLDDILFIDIHTHMFDGTSGWFVKDSSVRAFIEAMDRCGVDLAIASHTLGIGNECPEGNRRMKKAIEEGGGRIKGYWVVNGNFPDELEEETMKYKDEPGFVGAKFYSGIGLDGPNPNIALDNPGLDGIYDMAAKYNFPILVHTWGSESYPAAPNRFRRGLSRNPEMKLIVGHAGGDRYGHMETIELMREFPNVYYDITGTEFGHLWLKDLVKMTDPKRILFGSDLGGMDNRHYTGMVGFAEIDPEIKLDIFGRNAKRLLDSLSHV